ncbi:MAG: type II toxin-antitoxin system VapC family toxin [Pseudomonadota bacterium]
MINGLLIDTHIWLWFASLNPRLHQPGRTAIDAAIRSGRLRVSVISLLEISQLEAAGRLHLNMPVEEWVQATLTLPGLKVIELELPIILDAHRLPGIFHKDPANRILVATARHHELTLLSEDKKILEYAQQGYVHACSSTEKGQFPPPAS